MSSKKPNIPIDIVPMPTKEQFEQNGEALLLAREGVKSKRKGGIVLDYEIQNSEDLKKSEYLKHYEEPFKVLRLAFQSDPSLNNNYQDLYKAKLLGLPYEFAKKTALLDSLVASILQARQSQLSAFGRPRQMRNEIGFTFKIKQEYLREIEKMDPFEKTRTKSTIQQRIKRVSELLLTCGYTSGIEEDDKMTFSQFLAQSCRSALVTGKLATEIIKAPDPVREGVMRFHSFRPIDAGTIYKCTDYTNSAKAVRKSALQQLAQIKNTKLDPRLYVAGKYSWVQVIAGIPKQAFTADECLVYNFFQIPDIETDGYPISPIESAFAEIITHLNITNHNKLYFQSGRAARGIVVIQSDDVDDRTVSALRQQMNASINGVQNSWRLPVFAVGNDDKIIWTPIDTTARDMEFQYLSDMNARIILSAFQISPDELPGYSHLSRSTSGQSLSESNNEFKLEAHRDVGIRPLIRQIEDFLNSCIIPIIDEDLSKICVLELSGLDAETAEKEAQRIQTDSQLHLTYNEIMMRVEKKPIPMRMGGDYPLNPQIQDILNKFVPVGVQLEYWFGVKGASQDPKWDYVRDSYYAARQQELMQQQIQEQQMQQGGMMGQGQFGPPGVQQAVQQAQPTAEGNQEVPSNEGDTGLGGHVDAAIDELSKSEKQLSEENKRILNHHKEVVEHAMKAWDKDVDQATNEIMSIFKKIQPNRE